MTPIRKPQKTHQKHEFLCPHKTLFFCTSAVPEEAPGNVFYCDSPRFEMQVCVFAHLLTSCHPLHWIVVTLKKFYFVTAKFLLSVFCKYNTMICFCRYLNYRYGDWWGYWTLVIFKGRGGKICKNRDSNECLVGGSSALLKSPWTMKWPDKGRRPSFLAILWGHSNVIFRW